MVNYINKADGVRNCYGDHMDEEERNEFVRKSKQNEFQRMITFSPPENHGLSDNEMQLHARQTMDEYLRDRPGVSYCFSIHRDTNVPHVQVAATGTNDSLKMFDSERKELKQITEQKFGQSLDQEQEQDQSQQQAAQHTQSASESESDGISQSISRSRV